MPFVHPVPPATRPAANPPLVGGSGARDRVPSVRCAVAACLSTQPVSHLTGEQRFPPTCRSAPPRRGKVNLAAYHRQALSGKTLNSSTTLTRKNDGWWITLSYDEQ